MQTPGPIVIELPGTSVETVLENVPDSPAIFAIEARTGAPYLARTTLLRRRLRRLLRERSGVTGALSLASVARKVTYWPVTSQLSGALTHLAVAKTFYPEDYRRRLRLPAPAYLKLLRANPFPRCQISQKLTGGRSLWFGPFRSRGEAELFQGELLDLYAMRRCEEDLSPDPAHPGCVYGEIGKCLRPCQSAVSREQYEAETQRIERHLSTLGASATREAEEARDAASEEMDFEEAAKQHRRLEQIKELARNAGELPRTLDALHGIAVVPGSEGIELWPVYAGMWQPVLLLPLAAGNSLDRQLKEIWHGWKPSRDAASERPDDLALLSKWYYASWREGEWISLEDFGQIPYRQLVRRVSKAASGCISA